MQMLALPGPLFADFHVRCGSDGGAREMFQAVVTDLVDAINPDLALDVAGPGGRDWGIDSYVGSLDGDVYVWQSKFYLDFTQNNQSDVRESFKMVREKAESEGFSVQSWTLCVPCILPPDQQQWFDGWKSRTKRDFGIDIQLWNGTVIRRKLMSADADDVRRHYFEPGTSLVPEDPIAVHPDIAAYKTDALFVRQLTEAGNVETEAARGFFFATDVLLRDYQSRGDPDAIEGLKELSFEIHSIWESRFNGRVGDADPVGRIADLIDDVLESAAAIPAVQGVRAKAAHKRGMAHRLVEYQRAGWVKHWRDIALEYGEHQPSAMLEVSGEA